MLIIVIMASQQHPNTKAPPNATGLASITEMFIMSEIAWTIYYAIGEVAPAYVAIAVSNLTKRTRNGNPN